MKTKILPSFKSSKVFSFLILLSIFFFLFTLVKVPTLELEVKCKKIYENDTCVFNCSVNVGRNCLNRRFNGRFVVTHSGWAAIFDENFTFNCKTYFLIELPKRGYNYVMRGGVYDENKDFGTVEEFLFC